MKKINLNPKGFTLIEIIVSLAIFSVVAVIAIGALVRVTGANRQAQNIQSGINNMSFVLDSITREMRVGKNYVCVAGTDLITSPSSNSSCGSSLESIDTSGSTKDTRISFTSSNYDSIGKCNLIYAYIFHQSSVDNSVSIYKSEQPTNACTNTDPGTYTQIPVTASSVHLSDYRVGVFSTDQSGNTMPYNWVFIKLSGYVGDKQTERSNFDVQTSISQRISS